MNAHYSTCKGNKLLGNLSDFVVFLLSYEKIRSMIFGALPVDLFTTFEICCV